MAHSKGHSDRGVCAVNEALGEGAHDCEGFFGVLYVIHIALCCLRRKGGREGKKNGGGVRVRNRVRGDGKSNIMRADGRKGQMEK